MAEKLLAMASEHAFYTKPDGNNPLVVYPSDRDLPGAIATIVKRYVDSWSWPARSPTPRSLTIRCIVCGRPWWSRSIGPPCRAR